MAKYPVDLANAVHSEIKNGNPGNPSLAALTSLFETMFFASITTEESESIIFNVVYLDPDDPDPHPPERIVRDRWKCVRFSDTIRFNMKNIIKLAKASDPRTSSLAVYHNDENRLYVWGLIDQGNRYHDYAHFESETGPDRPGVFQASVEGAGYLSAYIKYQKIAELRGSRLIIHDVDVFSKGPIKDCLDSGLRLHIERLQRTVQVNNEQYLDYLKKTLSRYWYTAICRIILRIRGYGHGGAILFCNTSSRTGLNIKYKIKYDRLNASLFERAVASFEGGDASDVILTDYVERDKDVPLGLYLDETISDNDLAEIRSEMDGVLWFISLLSRVDGLVLMDSNLTVRGFGVEIKSNRIPGRLFRCSKPIPDDASLKKVNYNYFGTRHRSMIRYCWGHEGSVGFVISQDGDVRAMTRYEDKLVIWENIRLQAYTFTKKKVFGKRLRVRKRFSL